MVDAPAGRAAQDSAVVVLALVLARVFDYHMPRVAVCLATCLVGPIAPGRSDGGGGGGGSDGGGTASVAMDAPSAVPMNMSVSVEAAGSGVVLVPRLLLTPASPASAVTVDELVAAVCARLDLAPRSVRTLWLGHGGPVLFGARGAPSPAATLQAVGVKAGAVVVALCDTDPLTPQWEARVRAGRGTLVRRTATLSDGVASVRSALTPNGRWVVVVDNRWPTEYRVYDVRSGTRLLKLPFPGGNTNALTVAPVPGDNLHVAAVFHNSRHLLLRLTHEKSIRAEQSTAASHDCFWVGHPPGNLAALAVTPNGRHFAMLGDQQPNMLQIKYSATQELPVPPDLQCTALAAAADGQHFVCGTAAGRVCLLRVDGGGSSGFGTGGSGEGGDGGDDGGGENTPGLTCVWKRLALGRQPVAAMGLTPDGSHVLAAAADGSAFALLQLPCWPLHAAPVGRVRPPARRFQPVQRRQVKSVALSADCRRFATTCVDLGVAWLVVWSLARGAPVMEARRQKCGRLLGFLGRDARFVVLEEDDGLGPKVVAVVEEGGGDGDGGAGGASP